MVGLGAFAFCLRGCGRGRHGTVWQGRVPLFPSQLARGSPALQCLQVERSQTSPLTRGGG